ncbi:hypothetical protein IMZ31_24260 (plasmid) [Pontibacillus sp. ALD_SL1]|uniref:hypothetical protein n=1 Tax=Pontibacillus sp. ALD_SL1 TaxID=2777185 RepID=UPI001A9621B2|nr:hypothetical protein [Pontibacillus sp. ALD_SL1]QST02567.1 hypothetical protein IMZ31_24260 [Pontibacillus sp. ALD_SL1]
MGKRIVHFDQDWKDGKMRMDYEWVYNDTTYVIENIPIKNLPIGTDDGMIKSVAVMVEMIMRLQQDGKIHSRINFSDVEDLLDDW